MRSRPKVKVWAERLQVFRTVKLFRELVLRDPSSSEVAATLGISRVTASWHLARLNGAKGLGWVTPDKHPGRAAQGASRGPGIGLKPVDQFLASRGFK